MKKTIWKKKKKKVIMYNLYLAKMFLITLKEMFFF